MMGQQCRKESLFYYFRLEDQVPETHLLRLIDRYIDFSFVRDRLRNFYSQTGRPSIDPEVLLHLLLVGYLYGITSERRLLDEVRMHLAYRWFTGPGLTGSSPTIRPSPRTATGGFARRACFVTCSRRLFDAVSPRGWWRAAT